MKDANFAFLASTPYQIFNILNFVLNNEMNSKNHSDIYIMGLFDDSYSVFQKIQQLDIFNCTYYFQNYDKKFKSKYKIMNAIRVLFCKKSLKMIAVSGLDFRKRYTYVCFSSTHNFFLCFLRSFKYKEKISIDDGLASYMGSIQRDGLPIYWRFFDKVICKGKLFTPFKKIYLNYPDFYNGFTESEVCKLPDIRTLDKEYNIISQVFQYKKNNLYSDHRIVFLTQPFIEKEYKNEDEKKILCILKSFSANSLIVRVHPRQAPDRYNGYYVDTINNIWELECVYQITDRHILIGTSSTAQASAKFLFDKEPYVIFLYKILFRNKRNDFVIQSEITTCNLKKAYRCPERIFVPNTFDEFQRILRQIYNEI